MPKKSKKSPERLTYSNSAPRIIKGQKTLNADDFVETGTKASVISSNVASIQYNKETKTLIVEFKAKGRSRASIYRYEQVSPSLASGMFRCSSMGVFVHQVLSGHIFTKQLV